MQVDTGRNQKFLHLRHRVAPVAVGKTEQFVITRHRLGSHIGLRHGCIFGDGVISRRRR